MLGKIARALLVSVLSFQLAGCASWFDLELPGGTSVLAKDRYYYDPSIRAYRVIDREKAPRSPDRDNAARDSGGRKIQTAEELERYLRAQERSPQGPLTKAGTLGITIIYVPVLMAFGIVMLPWVFWSSHVAKTYEEAAEAAYAAGREHFANGRTDQAVAEWDRALVMMPSLRAYSDIDYWRGRAFQAAGDDRAAASAYRTFLDYSERSLPARFKKAFAEDPLWEEKAEDAEGRLLLSASPQVQPNDALERTRAASTVLISARRSTRALGGQAQ